MTGRVLLAVALAVMLTNPVEHALEDVVDLAELNHCYSTDGDLRFDQLIWWSTDVDGELRVVDWRIIKGGREKYDKAAAAKWEEQWRKENPGRRCPGYVPEWIGHQAVPVYRGGEWVSVWHDDAILRRVRSRSFVETWTSYDPELKDREIRPTDDRMLLRRTTRW